MDNSLENAGNKEGRWWFRYPLAALMLYAAWVLTNEYPEDEWKSWACLIFAAVQARELSLLILAGVFIYLFFKVVAILPASVAIIIGAIIIANSLSRR
ncbi:MULTISPECIES: hypothetical protein [Methylobacter]|jgi:hypothetical protein|uniref:hypothetical protein n=1 Tax=Methylobacter TaxID=429 RepID=UPI0003769E9A|nr:MULTISPECIES: hypothetical protein [Methylobacter]